jgi:hypothetical protein
MKPFFAPIIRLWPTVVAFAKEVGCPEGSAREWLRTDSIPAAWFLAVARAAAGRTDPAFREISVELLAERAEHRRLAGVERRNETERAAA